MESYGEVKIGSPQIKRKVIKDDSDSDDEDLFEKKRVEKKSNVLFICLGSFQIKRLSKK